MTTTKDRPDMGPIEVITSVQRRRRWAPEEKRAILEEGVQPGNSLSAVARKYGVNPNQLFHWRKLMREGALVAVEADENVVPASEVKQLKVKVRELERLLGKKTMEAKILREAIAIAREKNCCCGCLGPKKTIPDEGDHGILGRLPVEPVRKAGRRANGAPGALPEGRG